MTTPDGERTDTDGTATCTNPECSENGIPKHVPAGIPLPVTCGGSGCAAILEVIPD